MKPDRLKQIEELYHRALERAADEREQFLKDACSDDEPLREEVRSLLRHQGESSFSGFMEEETREAAARELSEGGDPPSVGNRLGSYHIVSLLGKGGMGEVYRARDSKLGREVAIKVLPRSFALDPERVSRFEREARLLASLNHPNIAAIYGLEEHEGTRFLVLELVEGDTLAELIRGPIPVEESLKLALQIAEALEAAHESGVIHRDLKPANIKVTPGGKVKVLDFGLAKAFAGTTADVDLSGSPTLSMTATQEGMLLGTPAYMSPEQARGDHADKRADVWAFGCVLYEMLTGRQTFEGPTVTDILASILKSEPDWNVVPTNLRPVLKRCLQRDINHRLRDIADVSLLLEDARSVPETVGPQTRAGVGWIVATALLLIAAVAFWGPWRAATPPDQTLMQFSTDLGVADGFGPTTAISPDGTRLAYRVSGPNGRPQLATRLLSETSESLLAGTEGAYNPFFSPDGESIAYMAAARLMKVSVEGDVPTFLADAPNGRIGSWGEDGFIYAELNPFSGILRIPDQGGPPEPLTQPSQRRHTWPQVLPDGESVLYTAGLGGLLENGRVEVLSVATGETRVVFEGGYMARYVASGPSTGHILYVRLGVLYAVPFDLERLEVLGDPVQVVDDIASSGASRGSAFDVSLTGTLVYSSGNVPLEWPIMWLDGSGNLESLLDTPGAYYTPRVSPDGDRLAYSVDSARGQDIYVYDMVRDTTVRLTFTSTANLWPVWAPDGDHIAFTSLTEENAGLWWARADGTGEPQLLLERENSVRQIMLSPDGRALAFTEQDPVTGSDLWILPLDISDPEVPRPGEPKALVQTSSNEGVPAFSPDGQWLAYLSDELGPYNVWVQPYPDLGSRWQVSSNGGGYPFWSSTDASLFYGSGPGGRLLRSEYSVEGNRFIGGRAIPWGGGARNPAPTGFETLDLAPDGQRFAIFPDLTEGPGGAGRVTFLLNFFDELRRRAPGEE